MRAWFALAMLAACRFDIDTIDPSVPGLRVHVSAAEPLSIATLDARIAFATVAPDRLFGLPADGSAPTLPLDQEIAIPQGSGTATITFTSVEHNGRRIVTTTTVEIVAGIGSASVVIDGDLPAACFNGEKDNSELGADCGGPCPVCWISASCVLDSDCATGHCALDHCEPASGPPGWLAVADAPVGRVAFGAALGGDKKIYAFGGALENALDGSEVDVYDPVRDLWVVLQQRPLPTPRVRIGGAADSMGTIYAIGGVDNSDLDSALVETFKPGAMAWDTATALPSARGFLAATADADGTIYAIGGVNATETDVLMTGGWSPRAALPVARSNHGAARLSTGDLIAVGGRVGDTMDITATAVSYSASADAWTPAPSLNHPRSDLSAVYAPDGRVYAIGGFLGQGVAFVEALRAGTGWVDVAPLAIGRDANASTVGPDGRIYVLGGRFASSEGTRSVEVYGPTFTESTDSGAVGDVFTVDGHNFAANAEVRVYLDSVPVAFGTTNATGELARINVSVPALAPGAHHLIVVDDRSAYPVVHPFTIR